VIGRIDDLVVTGGGAPAVLTAPVALLAGP
jgi:hypothetical protein